MSAIGGEFCGLLDQLGLGTYTPEGTGGDVFRAVLPPAPDAGLAVALYPGVPSDAHLGYDEPIVLVRVRGAPGDADGAEARAQAVYDALHGLRRRDLPGGTPMLSCYGTQGGPVFVGVDDQGRHEWTVTFTVELRRRTVNRV